MALAPQSGAPPAEGGTPEAPPASQQSAANTDKSGVQDRINTLTRKRREAERREAYWRGKAEATPAPAPASTPAAAPKAEDLNPDDFDTNADYLKAFAKTARTEARAEITRDQEQKRTADSQAKIQTSYSKGRETYDDFDDVALDPSVPISQNMFDAAVGDNLDKILYHLGSNTGEAARIAALPPTQQVKEVGILEAKLKAEPPAKTTTNAPAPPSIVGSGASPQPVPDSELNRAELHTKWEKERRAAAGVR